MPIGDDTTATYVSSGAQDKRQYAKLLFIVVTDACDEHTKALRIETGDPFSSFLVLFFTPIVLASFSNLS